MKPGSPLLIVINAIPGQITRSFYVAIKLEMAGCFCLPRLIVILVTYSSGCLLNCSFSGLDLLKSAAWSVAFMVHICRASSQGQTSASSCVIAIVVDDHCEPSQTVWSPESVLVCIPYSKLEVTETFNWLCFLCFCPIKFTSCH